MFVTWAAIVYRKMMTILTGFQLPLIGSSYKMDAILVIDRYNSLLCIDVYLPDYATTSSMRPNHMCV
jgi:hypothetical protein